MQIEAFLECSCRLFYFLYFHKGHQMISSLKPLAIRLKMKIAEVQVEQALDKYERLKIIDVHKSISESDFFKISCVLKQARA